MFKTVLHCKIGITTADSTLIINFFQLREFFQHETKSFHNFLFDNNYQTNIE